MKIVTVGAGYVGLVSGVCMAEIGHAVTCVDLNEARIAKLEAGQSPIYEPGLDDIVARNVAAGRLGFSTDLAGSVAGAEAVFICVGTPERPDGRADLSYVFAAARELAGCVDPGTVIVTKSTVPLGTNRKVRQILEDAGRKDLFVASNPEFLREGSAIVDFMEPDRIVVGVDCDAARDVLEKIYQPLVVARFPCMITDLESAEMIKYASNAFLATKVTFINEISRLCEKTGADVADVSRGMGLDSRIGPKFLQAGPGYGGSCFPKDTSALASMGEDWQADMSITRSVIASNTAQKAQMISRLRELCDGDFAGKKVAVFGVTFKPETDDMREAPSLSILPALQDEGASLSICDPQGRKEGAGYFPGAAWCEGPLEAAKDADVVVILTEWSIFRDLDLPAVAQVMAQPRMADFRNVFDARAAREAGFEAYRSVGRQQY